MAVDDTNPASEELSRFRSTGWDPTLQQGTVQSDSGPCQAAEGFVGKPGPQRMAPGTDATAEAIPRSIVQSQTTNTTTLASTTTRTWKCLRCRFINPSTHAKHDKQLCRQCEAPRSLNVEFFKTIYRNEKPSYLAMDHRINNNAQMKFDQQQAVLALKDAHQDAPPSKRQKKRQNALPRQSAAAVANTGNIRLQLKKKSTVMVKSATKWYRGKYGEDWTGLPGNLLKKRFIEDITPTEAGHKSWRAHMEEAEFDEKLIFELGEGDQRYHDEEH